MEEERQRRIREEKEKERMWKASAEHCPSRIAVKALVLKYAAKNYLPQLRREFPTCDPKPKDVEILKVGQNPNRCVVRVKIIFDLLGQVEGMQKSSYTNEFYFKKNDFDEWTVISW